MGGRVSNHHPFGLTLTPTIMKLDMCAMKTLDRHGAAQLVALSDRAHLAPSRCILKSGVSRWLLELLAYHS